MPARWYIPVKVRRSKQSYEYPRITIPVEAIRKAGFKPNDILVLVEAGGVLLLAREDYEAAPEKLMAGVLEALGYSVEESPGGLMACKDGECIVVSRLRMPREASGGTREAETQARA